MSWLPVHTQTNFKEFVIQVRNIDKFLARLNNFSINPCKYGNYFWRINKNKKKTYLDFINNMQNKKSSPL